MLITDVRPGEVDLIAGHESEPLVLRSLDGRKLASIPAAAPWTHEKLIDTIHANRCFIEEAGGAEYYLGEQFVGSTEV